MGQLPLSREQKRKHVRSRIRDFVLYVLIALTLAALAIASAQFGVSHDAFIKWGGLAFMTALLFGYFISESPQYLREHRFWRLLVISLAVHLAVFAIILSLIREWKLMWFLIMIIEYPPLVLFRDRLPFSSSERGYSHRPK